MAHWTRMTEHAGAKNGGGFRGKTSEAKADSKVGRRQMDRFLIEEFLADMAAEEAEQDAVDAFRATCITVDDLPEGDLFVVSVTERWEGPQEVLMTRSADRAVEAFNGALADVRMFGDTIEVKGLSANSMGDFTFSGRTTRPYQGGFEDPSYPSSWSC